MKKYCIIIFFLAFSLFANSFSSADAKEFQFLNINWNDSPNEVIQKLKDTYFFSGIGFSTPTGETESIPGNMDVMMPRMIDGAKNEYLRKANYFPKSHKERRAIGTLPFLKVLVANGKYNDDDIPISLVTFYFTYDTNELVGYKITLKEQCAMQSGLNSTPVYAGLKDKYGKPTKKPSNYSIKWESNGQSLYYGCLGRFTLVYLNDRKIKNHISNFQAVVKKYRGNESNRKKSIVKKTF